MKNPRAVAGAFSFVLTGNSVEAVIAGLTYSSTSGSGAQCVG
jgi:hypothetical protein